MTASWSCLAHPLFKIPGSAPETDKVVLSMILPTIIAVGLIGNVAFLYVIARLERFHTLTNVYLINIAMAEIITISYAPILYVWSYFKSPIINYMPIENSVGCFTVWAVSYWGYFPSINTFTLVSLERWLAICRPLQHRRMKGKSRTIKFITSAWLIGFILAIFIASRYGKSVWFCMEWPNT